jgi:hypothetical protein
VLTTALRTAVINLIIFMKELGVRYTSTLIEVCLSLGQFVRHSKYVEKNDR